jgi:glycosyltransferase involved in cell wall biosynthesis
MRILHVIAGIDKSTGGPTYALESILGVEKLLGASSTLLTLSSKDPLESIARLASLTVFPATFPRRYSASRGATRWLKAQVAQFDIVLVHGIWALLNIIAAGIARDAHVPYVVVPHGSLDPFDLKKKKALKYILGPLFVRPFLSHSRVVRCTATTEATRLETFGGNCKIEVLALPVRRPDVPGSRDRFRRKLNIREDEFIFLFLSRINYKKGLDILIPALAEARRSHPEARLVIAGSGSNQYNALVRRWIEVHDLSQSVCLCGFLSGRDKQDAFAGSDCFVLPSLNENFGMAIIEAMWEGLPSIISKHVYIGGDIQDSSWICENTVESLAECMIDALSRAESYFSRKNHAKSTAWKFRPDNLVQLYNVAYRDAMTPCR